MDGPAWLDEAARRSAARLAAFESEEVVGHGDFESQNVRWVRERPLVVHDWDSVVARPEAALVGVASAIFTATGEPGAAGVDDSAAFIHQYETSRGTPFSDDEREAAWAGSVWVRAFNAKKAVVRGLDVDAELTAAEAERRLAEARA